MTPDPDDYRTRLREAFDAAMAEVDAMERDRHWIIPKSHRPTCPVSNNACTSWSCVFDVCVGEPL